MRPFRRNTLIICGSFILLSTGFILYRYKNIRTDKSTQLISQSSPIISNVQNEQPITLNYPTDSNKQQQNNVIGSTKIKTVIKLSVKEKADNKNADNTPIAAPQKMVSMPVLVDTTNRAMKYANIKSLSTDKTVEGKIVNINNIPSLMFFPFNNDWNETFIILPYAIVGKQKLTQLVYRNFSGVTYPSYSRAKINIDGVMEDVKVIKMKGIQPNSENPYYINLSANPRFLIFGDYNNKAKWYIYQNNVVKHFSASELHVEA